MNHEELLAIVNNLPDELSKPLAQIVAQLAVISTRVYDCDWPTIERESQQWLDDRVRKSDTSAEAEKPAPRFCVNVIAEMLPHIPDGEPLKAELAALKESMSIEQSGHWSVWNKLEEIMRRRQPSALEKLHWHKVVYSIWFGR